LKYSSTFCKAFKESSQKELAQLYKEHLLNAKKINPYLTASGGILYHKANHPFVNSHHLVEGLCAKAKKLTKDLGPEISPAALAFFRLSNSVTGDIETLCRQSQVFSVKDVHGESLLSLGVNAYVVDQNDSHQSLDNLFECIKLSNKEKTAVSMTKWRQMATELALGDKVEADRIYARAMSLCENKAGSEQVKQLQKLSGDNTDSTQWYWSVTNQESPYLQSVISDMLIVDHFSIVNAEEHSNTSTKETA
jgi:hypothetical protein